MVLSASANRIAKGSANCSTPYVRANVRILLRQKRMVITVFYAWAASNVAKASNRTLLLPVDRSLAVRSCRTDNCLAQLFGLIGAQLESRVIAECHVDGLEPSDAVERAAGCSMDAPAVFGHRLDHGHRSDL